MDLSDAPHDASGTRAALELRVLSGRQSGARALLPSDGAWTQLGRLDSNDLVLRDAPFDRVEVGFQDGQWVWRAADGGEVPLQAGQGVRFGEFVLLLCRPSEPWREEWPEQWAIDGAVEGASDGAPQSLSGDEAASGQTPRAPGPESAVTDLEGLAPQSEPAADALTGPSADGGVSPSAADAQTQVAHATPQSGLGARARHMKWAAASAGALTVLAMALWSMGVWRDAQEPRTPGPGLTASGSTTGGPPGGSVPAAAVAPPVSDLETVTALLADSAKAVPGLKAVAGSDGRVVLKGVVRDDEALETALRPMIRAGVRVSLQALTAREFDLRAQSLARQLPKGLSVQAMPDGTLKIFGELASDAVLPGLQALAAQEVPESLGFEWAVSTTSTRQELEKLAQQADAQRVARLPPVAPLPEVVSVIGGADAHVVLADGLRVSPGGFAGNWRLLSVADSAIVFVDPQGRQRKLSL